MSTRKLSKALSPRSGLSFDSEPAAPPRPTPRQRQAPAPLPTTPREAPRVEETPDSAEDLAKKLEKKLTASEIVAAASRRPSGRDDDLPQPPPVSPPAEVPEDPAPERPSEDSRAASGMFTPREDAPVFAAVARKVSPVPTPRPKSRSSSEDKQDGLDCVQTPRADEEEQKAVVDEVVQAHTANVSHAAAPPATKPKIPPPVAPKPKRTSSVSSDKSYSSAHSDEVPSSPTIASSGTPAGDDSTQSRKFVSSAARMFERKASEVKPVSPLTHPTRSSVPVSSVVKNFNRAQDSEPSGKSEVVMRRISVGGSSGSGEGEGGKRLNSALLPPGDRRRSMPGQLSGSSLALTRPSSLSHLRHQPPARGGSISEEGETEKASPRFNSALRPRQAFSTSSPLRSVLTPRDHNEDKQTTSDQADKDSEVTYRPKPSGSSSRETTPRKAMSWTSQTGDSHSPRMIFTSSSLHNTPRHGASSWGSDKSDHLESTMKKFDDLLSDKHTFDSDEELPKVSNSVSLDLLKNRGAKKTASAAESSDEPSAKPAAQDTPVPVTSVTESKETVSDHTSRSEEPSERKDSVQERRTEPSKPAETESTTEVSRTEQVSSEELVPVKEESTVTSVQTTESSPAEKTIKTEHKAEIATTQLQYSEPSIQLNRESEQSKEPESVSRRVVDSDQNQSREETVPLVPEQPPQEQPPAEQPQPRARKSRRSVEEAEDAPPQQDAAAAAALDPPATESIEDKTAEADVSVGEDTYPEEDAALSIDVAQDTIYQQQASSIVHTVITNALKDVASRPKLAEPAEEDDSPPPPPLPTEEPPPLPGAPPPPLILREMMGTLVDSEDLVGMLPSQGTSTRSSPRSQPDVAESAEVSPRSQPYPADVLQSEDVELQVEETLSADTTALNFSLPLQPSFPEKSETQPEEDKEAVRDSEVLISFHSSSSQLPPSTELSGDLPGREGKLDQAPEDQPPVSDTLSQDSGVQDEDMSEDGLRFSHDESPTSQADSSVFAMTPEESVSVFKEAEVDRNQTSSKSPVPSPRSKLAPSSPRSVPTPTSTHATVEDVGNVADSKMKESSSVQKSVQDHVQSADPLKNADSANQAETLNKDDASLHSIEDSTEEHKDSPQPPKPSPRNQAPKEAPTTPPADSDMDSAVVKSCRKWCILDQSGSLFLHGEKDSAVGVTRDALRQVSSMLPGDLADMISEANKGLDEAHLAKNVELRTVSARGLTGRTLSVEVTQREDYFVQVTRVHTKDSVVEEADLLMAVDGRTLKHRRPAQVQSQLESTGPKGVLLTARGVKLPSSLLLKLQEDRGTSESDSNSESPRSLPPSPRSASAIPAVEVSPGVYDVIMVKGATGVGFCLEGGKASPKGDLPILIKRIFKGGPAEKCGHLQVKDEILAVNGVDFTVMRHYEAWNHLKFLDDGEIRLRIRRPE